MSGDSGRHDNMIIRPEAEAERRCPDTSVRGWGVPVAVGCLVLAIVGAGGSGVALAAVAGAQRGGEARDALRLSVRTNGTEGSAVRVRAGEQVLRSYRIVNRAEYGLSAVISDQQVPGGQAPCGQSGQGGQGIAIAVPPLGTVECSVRLVAGAGALSGGVRCVRSEPGGGAERSVFRVGAAAGDRIRTGPGQLRPDRCPGEQQLTWCQEDSGRCAPPGTPRTYGDGSLISTVRAEFRR